MSKYSVGFKQAVVEFYSDGTHSYHEVSLQFGLDESMVRKWVASHAAHGVAGLSRKYSHYDAQFRLSVLERMWKDGLSRRQAAALFNIRSAACLSVWEDRYEHGGIEALAPRRKGRPRSMPEPPIIAPGSDAPKNDEAKSREELLAELAYLRMENDYLKKLEALTQAHPTPNGRKLSRR